MDNVLALHQQLEAKTYHHGSYQAFKVNDPKPRDIHKASVQDRLVHHAVYRILYPYFDRRFIHDSYSCRTQKGTHRAMDRFRYFARKVSRNGTRTAWILKCDVRKFFASIDHAVLLGILRQYIADTDTLALLDQIIGSFHTPSKPNVGLPLGNLTSQLLVNIYLNELDQYIKRSLKVRCYVRYADDFVLLHEQREYLVTLVPVIAAFLGEHLKLHLHPRKVFIKTLASGVDFLGWVHFPHHRVLRTTSRRRMLKKLQRQPGEATRASYLGLLSHGNAHKLSRAVR